MLLFLSVITFPARVRDRVLNALFSILCKAPVHLVWSEVKILGATRIRFGEHFTSGRGLWLEAVRDGTLEIGDRVNVSDWVHIGALQRVRIGNGCLLGSKVMITDHAHGPVDALDEAMRNTRPDARPLVSKGPVILEDNVWLGDAVVVLPGVTIGRNTIVGANSVVTRDLPPDCIAVGIPARVLRSLCQPYAGSSTDRAIESAKGRD